MENSGANRIEGVVELETRKTPKPIRSFVEKQIKTWAERKAGTASSEPIQYRVRIKRSPESHYFLCRMEILVGKKQGWAGSVTETSLHQALIRCVRNLSPIQLQPALSVS